MKWRDVEIHPLPGTDIADACREALEMARATNRPVTLVFNDVRLRVGGQDSVDRLVEYYLREVSETVDRGEKECSLRAKIERYINHLRRSRKMAEEIARELEPVIRQVVPDVRWQLGGYDTSAETICWFSEELDERSSEWYRDFPEDAARLSDVLLDVFDCENEDGIWIFDSPCCFLTGGEADRLRRLLAEHLARSEGGEND